MVNNEGGQLFGGNKPDVEVPEEAPVVEWNQDRTTLASLWVEKAMAFRDIARTVTPVSDRTAAYHSQNSHLYEVSVSLVFRRASCFSSFPLPPRLHCQSG